MNIRAFFALLIILSGLVGCSDSSNTNTSARKIRIGSKPFTESKILSYMLWHLSRAAEAPTELPETIFGNVMIFEFLRNGDIDMYVDYTGSIRNLLSNKRSLDAALSEANIATIPLQFENSYALAVKPNSTIKSITQLQDQQGLIRVSAGLFQTDIIKKIKAQYRLSNIDIQEWNPAEFPGKSPTDAVLSGDILATEVYTTDPEATKLQLLNDEKNVFPDYHAIILYRTDRISSSMIKALNQLRNKISENEIRQLIAEVHTTTRMESLVAENYLRTHSLLSSSEPFQNYWIIAIVISIGSGLIFAYWIGHRGVAKQNLR